MGRLLYIVIMAVKHFMGYRLSVYLIYYYCFMRFFFLWATLLVVGLGTGCESTTTDSETSVPPSTALPLGIWRATLDIGTPDAPKFLPFTLELVAHDDPTRTLPILEIHNGEETIEVTDLIKVDDNLPSFQAQLPIFNSQLEFQWMNDTLIGVWRNNNKKDYVLPFKAVRGIRWRFAEGQRPTQGLAERWKVTFSPDKEKDSYPAIGKFYTDTHGRTTGTFVTETGDYRFLEGHFDGKKLQLSCFDGAHAFLFDAQLQADGQLVGMFHSGKHWKEPWIAVPSTDFQLADMQTLTFLKEGYESISFAFPDVKGDTVRYDSTKFKGSVTIVEISGSWCPNCMDAGRFLQELYTEYQDQGLSIIAIDYELKDDFESFRESAERLHHDMGLTYPILFGGLSQKQKAAQTLPMLNHILSYPTLIFIGRDGKVRMIHTGFSGPGTGEEYTQYVTQTRQLVQRLLHE